MSTITAEITAEQSTALVYVTKASFPASKLSPWMQITDETERLVFSEMITVNNTHEFLMAKLRELKSGKKIRHGASAIIAFMNKEFAQNLGDYSPSVKGLGRKQAIILGSSQKQGVAVQPNPRSKWEKMTGQGKEKDYLSGVD